MVLHLFERYDIMYMQRNSVIRFSGSKRYSQTKNAAKKGGMYRKSAYYKFYCVNIFLKGSLTMRRHFFLLITVIAETVLILLLAVLLWNPAEKKDLSQLPQEKQIAYLHSEGIQFSEEYNAYALIMIKNCERDPDYESDVSIYQDVVGGTKPELSDIRSAVNKYYGRTAEG